MDPARVGLDERHIIRNRRSERVMRRHIALFRFTELEQWKSGDPCEGKCLGINEAQFFRQVNPQVSEGITHDTG